MRDYLVSLIVFGSVPVILMRPYVGVLVWSWLGFMNPHRLTEGFAFDYPFAQVVAGAVVAGLLFSREAKRIPMNAATMVWMALVLWMGVTTLFAFVPEHAFPHWEKAMKIQLFGFITMMVMRTHERLNMLVWVIVISLGFFGVKGGMFALLTGGEYRVYGPPKSFIEDNNTLALALIMTLPLMRYLQLEVQQRWLQWSLLAGIGLSVVAIFSSHSRGALVAGVAMGLFMLLKSHHKFRIGLVMVIMGMVALSFLPEKWFERMETIRTYEQDPSAMGRINAWGFAWNLATDRPLVGGGFSIFTPAMFQEYAPDPLDVHDSHSIYFEMLAEQGFVGLGLFLLLGMLAFRAGGWVNKNAHGHADLRWATNLATTLQVSIVGYAIGGAFLGVAYFDLYYCLVAMLLILRHQVKNMLEQKKESLAAPASATGVALSSR